jgi:hypothetical protein
MVQTVRIAPTRCGGEGQIGLMMSACKSGLLQPGVSSHHAARVALLQECRHALLQLLKSEVGRVCRPFGRNSSKYDSGRMGQSYEALHVECPFRLGALDGLPAKSGREGIKHLG